MKTCTRCGIEKNEEDFYLRSKKTKRLRSICKDCNNAEGSQYWTDNKERLSKQGREYSRKYHAENRAARNKYSLAYSRRPTTKYRLYVGRLKSVYGLEESTLRSMMDHQRGCCPVCLRSLDHIGVFHVDHCHTTMKVRGLLCGPCNGMLGLADDKRGTLRRAINYLEESYE